MKRVVLIIVLILAMSVHAQRVKQKTEPNNKELQKVEEKQEIKKEEAESKPIQTKSNEAIKLEEQKAKVAEPHPDIQKSSPQPSKQDKLQTARQIRKKPVKIDELKRITKWKNSEAESPAKQLKFKKYHHKPLKKLPNQQQIYYESPVYYHYTIHPVFLYRGIWIRYYFIHDNGFLFYNGYPYYVYNNHLHRYSFTDSGYYDLVDRLSDEVYATFYGRNLKESYDRAAQVRDILNNEAGYYRYFCAERFEYDPDYYYGWDSADFPDWYWE